MPQNVTCRGAVDKGLKVLKACLTNQRIAMISA